MNFSEYRTLAERARRENQIAEDEFEDNRLESPGWVKKYLDLADRAIQRSKEQEEGLQQSRVVHEKWQRYG
jgi:hypothetical protein